MAHNCWQPWLLPIIARQSQFLVCPKHTGSFKSEVHPRLGITWHLNVGVRNYKISECCVLYRKLLRSTNHSIRTFTSAVRDRMQALARMQKTRNPCLKNAKKALHTTKAHSDIIQNVPKRSCKVASCSYGQVFRNTKLSSSTRSNTRPNIPHAYDKRNRVSLPHAIMTIARTIHRVYILIGAHGCDIIHCRLRIRRDFRNSLRHKQTRYIVKYLRHYRLHWFLIATSGATTIYARLCKDRQVC